MVDLVYNAGIRIRELEAEVARLKKRLEITHAYDGAGNEIPFPAGMEDLDGIACRDETIRQQDQQIAKLRVEVAALASAPPAPSTGEGDTQAHAILRVIDSRLARGDMPGHNFPAEWWPVVAATMRAALSPVPGDAGDLAGLSERANAVVQRVAEWDDRTSPEDWPEAMLITGEELHKELVAFAQETAALAPAAPRPAGETTRDAINDAICAWANKLPKHGISYQAKLMDLSELRDTLCALFPAAPRPAGEDLAGQGETQTADHIAALAVTSEETGRELTLVEVLEAGFKRFGYAHPAEAAREACETIAAGPLPPRALEPDVLHRIYSQFIVNRGDLSDAEVLEAIRRVCEQAGQGAER